MKICFFSENHYKGGIDTFIINLVNAWPQEADILTYVCNDSNPGIVSIKDKIIRPLNILRYKHFFLSCAVQRLLTLRGGWGGVSRKAFLLLYKIIEYPILFPWYLISNTIFFVRYDFDRLLVINGGYPASLISRSAIIAWWLAGKRSKAIMNFHSAAAPSRFPFSFFDDLLDQLLIKLSSGFIGVSQACLLTLGGRSSFKDCNKLSYIYNGIQDPANDVVTLGISGDSVESSSQPYCLMLATYHAYKGHAFLLEAFKSVVKEFPRVQLHIYGHGLPTQKENVIKEVRRLGLNDNVMLGDFVSNIAPLLSRASLLVVPSQAYEAFGLVIIEAMSLGVPVVATDVGGMPEIIGYGGGYICSKNNPQNFANAIKCILRDQNLARNLGNEGRKIFEEKFMASAMALKYYNAISCDT